MVDPANHRAVTEARHYAAMYRKAGYPEAEACPEYCIDEVSDGYLTYTVSVRLGPYDESTIRPGILRALRTALERKA